MKNRPTDGKIKPHNVRVPQSVGLSFNINHLLQRAAK